VNIDLDPGRWLVEIGTDGHLACRINAADRAHGGDGPDLHLPGVNAWLDSRREVVTGPPGGRDDDD
jgi:hypothetical protein